MVVFVGFLLFLGYGFDRFYLGDGEFVFPIGTLTALGVGSVSALISYYSGDRAVLLSTGAVPIDRALSAETTEDAAFKLRQLDNVVEEMSIAAGLPKPKVYVVPDPDPNAFATGRDPEHASIAVTRGLLDAVTRDELQGVVAHELSHVRNLDIRLMTVIAAMVGTLALLSDWTGRGLRHGSSWRKPPRPEQGQGRLGRDSAGHLDCRGAARADHRPDARDDGVAPPRVSGGRVGRRADAQSAGARARARENRARTRADRLGQARHRAFVHRGSAREIRGAAAGMGARPACVASADAEPHYRAATDGVSGVMLAPGQKPGGGRAQAAALVLLRVLLGVFMFFFGLDKASWLLDATPLSTQLSSWLLDAPPASRWYLERIIPGAPVFARAVPLGAMLGGLALALGIWTRIAAAMSLVVVLSLQLGAGSMFRYAYLMDASGLPLVGGLLALIIGGDRENVKRRAKNE